MGAKIRIGALISGGGTNLQAIIDACEAGRIAGQMVFVGSDKPGGRGLERAQKSYFQPSDEALFAAFVKRALKLPSDEGADEKHDAEGE